LFNGFEGWNNTCELVSKTTGFLNFRLNWKMNKILADHWARTIR